MASVQSRGKYTTEFKLEAVRQVKTGQAISVAASVWFFDRSANTWGADWLRLDTRSASAANAWRKSKPVV